MPKIKVVGLVLLVRKLRHGFTKNAKVSPNLTVAYYLHFALLFSYDKRSVLCNEVVCIIPAKESS